VLDNPYHYPQEQNISPIVYGYTVQSNPFKEVDWVCMSNSVDVSEGQQKLYVVLKNSCFSFTKKHYAYRFFAVSTININLTVKWKTATSGSIYLYRRGPGKAYHIHRLRIYFKIEKNIMYL